MIYKTEQEKFWSGEFGTEYIKRNNDKHIIASNVALFAKALHATKGIKNCIEFGSNIGLNLQALRILFPDLDQTAIEINQDAVKELEKNLHAEKIIHDSILNFDETKGKYDLVLIKGVLIHINPDELGKVYEKLVKSCGKYLLVVEYYNPTPVAIPYRGHNDRLFKRDFAGEILDRHNNMELVDYGFCYRRDNNFPQDDGTWFLMKKIS